MMKRIRDRVTNQPNTLISGMLLISWVVTAWGGEAGYVTDLKPKLTLKDASAREEALKELDGIRLSFLMRNAVIEVDGKYELFRELLKVESTYSNYTLRSVRLLARLEEDPEILKYAKDTIVDPGASIRDLVGCLAYLEQTRPRAFQNYFASRDYFSLDPVLIQSFSSSAAMREIQRKTAERMVNECMDWKGTRNIADEMNPHQQKIWQYSRTELPIVDVLNERAIAMSKEVGGMDLEITLLLGQVGSETSFPILLDEYTRNPSMNVGRSIGSCLSEENIHVLFEDKITSEEDRFRELLSHIYGVHEWSRVKDKPIAEIKMDLEERLREIRRSCVMGCTPILG